jgi:hypothetical protein
MLVNAPSKIRGKQRTSIIATNKLVNQWNKAYGGWKYWVVDITTCHCHGIPKEGELLEEQGVKYQFVK